MDPTRSVVVEMTHNGGRGNIELTVEEWLGSRSGGVSRSVAAELRRA